MRLGPGFPIGSLTVSASGCDVTVEKDSNGCKVVVTPGKTTLIKFGKTATEALENAATELERMAASLRELTKIMEKL